MQTIAAVAEIAAIERNVRLYVESLELCWWCNRVCRCSRFVLGGAVNLPACQECAVKKKLVRLEQYKRNQYQ